MSRHTFTEPTPVGETRPCVRGCTIHREHLATCEDPEHCWGCLPQRAKHGRLCWNCHRRLDLMLHDAETVDRWLTGNLPAGSDAARPREDYERGGGDESPTPIKLAIYEVRQTLRDTWAEWVDWLTEREGLTGPGRHTVASDATFLRAWIGRVEAWGEIGDLWEFAAEQVSQAHALAPWRPTMRRIPRTPCPRCGEVNLAIFGGESDVSCLSCRSIMLEEHFAHWQYVLKVEAETA